MIAIADFTSRFQKLSAADVLDLEFVVAQSLHFEFWARGAERALRGWTLELQVGCVDMRRERAYTRKNCPSVSEAAIQTSLPQALTHIQLSRQTDAELLFTPAQIGMACLRMANRQLVDSFLSWRYELSMQDDAEEPATAVYGVEREKLLTVLDEVEECIKTAGDGAIDLKAVKQIDKRLRLCQNPEKVPGTAL